jgi:hypothetical protein
MEVGEKAQEFVSLLLEKQRKCDWSDYFVHVHVLLVELTTQENFPTF